MNSKNKVIYHGLGRRKTSVSQVTLTPGTGKIIVNNKDVYSFFPYKTLVQDLSQPLKATDSLEKWDVIVKVSGGGFTGQSGATRLGISRALLTVSEDFRSILRQSELLTRDARIKERKKYGLKGARKAPQYSKR